MRKGWSGAFSKSQEGREGGGAHAPQVPTLATVIAHFGCVALRCDMAWLAAAPTDRTPRCVVARDPVLHRPQPLPLHCRHFPRSAVVPRHGQHKEAGAGDHVLPILGSEFHCPWVQTTVRRGGRTASDFFNAAARSTFWHRRWRTAMLVDGALPLHRHAALWAGGQGRWPRGATTGSARAPVTRTHAGSGYEYPVSRRSQRGGRVAGTPMIEIADISPVGGTCD